MNEKGKLTQAEANRLINMLKTTLCKEITFPSRNSGTEFDVQGDTKQDIFTIKIFRSKIRHDKYTFGARIKKDGILLLELHVNPGNPHMNPDGTIITESHWHIYQEGYDRKFAFLAEDIVSDNFVENTILFFEKFNLVQKPEIYYQLEIIP